MREAVAGGFPRRDRFAGAAVDAGFGIANRFVAAAIGRF